VAVLDAFCLSILILVIVGRLGMIPKGIAESDSPQTEG